MFRKLVFNLFIRKYFHKMWESFEKILREGIRQFALLVKSKNKLLKYFPNLLKNFY